MMKSIKKPIFKRLVMTAFAIPLSAIAVISLWSPGGILPSRATASPADFPVQANSSGSVESSVSMGVSATADPIGTSDSPATATVAENVQAPEILFPQKNARIAITDRTVRWSPVPSADTYDIVITDTARWEKVFSEIGLNETQLTLDNGIFQFGGKYSIAVSAKAGGLSSDPGRIDFSIQDPPAPVITEPSDESALRVADLTVQWQPVTGAESYKVVVTDTTTWKIIHTETVRNATRLVLEKALFAVGGQYRIYLMAVHEGNDTKPNYVDISTFKLSSPGILSPSKGAVLPLSDILVQWEPVIMAEKYGVTLKDLASGTILSTEEGFRDCKRVISRKNLAPGMKYRIYVHSCTGENRSEPTWVDVSIPPLSPPKILAPVNDSILPSTDLLVEWTPVEMADSYQVAVTDTSTWQVIFLSPPIQGASCKVDASLFSAGGSYRIYVHATMGKTDSVPAYVNASRPLLAAPFILAPTNASYLPAADLELSWSSIAEADRYRVTVTDTNTWEIVFSQEDIDATTLLLEHEIFITGSNYRIYVASISSNTESAPNYIDIGIGTAPGKAP